MLLCRGKTGLDCCIYDEEETGDPLLFIEGCNINPWYIV